MPELSIIVATSSCDRCARRLIPRLVCKPDGAAIELILVDYGSGGSQALPNAPFAVTVKRAATGAPVDALNDGIGLARGRVCLFIDEDVLPEAELVDEHLAMHRGEHGAVVVGRRLLDRSGRSWYLREVASAREARHERLVRGDRRLEGEDWLAGNLSVPRAALVAAGGLLAAAGRFAPVELAYRLGDAGLRHVYAPKARCHQVAPLTPVRLLSRAVRHGHAAVRLSRIRPSARADVLDFNDRPGYSMTLRRTLLATRLPPRAVLALAGALSKRRPSSGLASFVSSYAYWRGVRASATPDEWVRLTGGTSMLMYHAVAPRETPPTRFIVPLERLDRHLRTLRWLRRTPISLEQYIADRVAHRLPPARAVVVTFDDGYVDNLELAAPVLARHGVPATVFVVTGRLGGSNSWDMDGDLAGRPLMSWQGISELRRSGLGVGAHTRTHRALPSLDAATRRNEIAGSKADLEERLGETVRAFAFPYGLGAADIDCAAAVAQAGFDAACSVLPGRNTDATPLLALRRTEVYGTDSLLRFVQAVLLGDSQAIWRRRGPGRPARGIRRGEAEQS
jgi:peptidoglycan/xylan/chitin deacetylase (PgdA/CDA1 family)